MHPFGGSPVCPRCSKAVYAAEQVMGPGRKLYHKPCLACTSCRKRLDSYNLVEHDEAPYCKNCHIKNFGTQDLRQANLPRAKSPPLSPPKTNGRLGSASPPLVTSPVRGTLIAARAATSLSPTHDAEAEESQDSFDIESLPSQPMEARRTINNAIGNGITLGRSSSAVVGGFTARPLVQTATGTRYGAALGGGVKTNTTGTPKWGGSTPKCAKCNKSAYFAEQVKAVGKIWHKNCLRCTECNALLDAGRTMDHEGTPLCSRCYNKLHGPAGNGYGLL